MTLRPSRRISARGLPSKRCSMSVSPADPKISAIKEGVGRIEDSKNEPEAGTVQGRSAVIVTEAGSCGQAVKGQSAFGKSPAAFPGLKDGAGDGLGRQRKN